MCKCTVQGFLVGGAEYQRRAVWHWGQLWLSALHLTTHTSIKHCVIYPYWSDGYDGYDYTRNLRAIHSTQGSLAMTLTPHKFIQIWWQHLAVTAPHALLYMIPITLNVLCVNPCSGIDKIQLNDWQSGVVHGYRLPTDHSTQLSTMLLNYWEESCLVSTSNYCHDTKCWSVAGVDHWASSMVLNDKKYSTL